MAETYRRYPGFEQNSVSNEADGHLENLKILGYSVMKNVLTQDFSAYLEKRLLDLWDEQDEEFGRTRLEELGERGTHRGLLTKDKEFTDLVVHPRVLDVIYGVLGETAILNLQNASAAFPGQTHFQSAMHRDFAKDFVSSKPLSVNAFWCVTDFTEENGATEIVPGSHSLPHFPSSNFLTENSIKMIAPAGSVIFWDSLLLHKTGFNKTNKTRFGINHMYTRPFIKQQVDYPVFLKGMHDMDSKLAQILGFWTIPPKSIKEFRVDSNKRTYRGGQG